MNTKIHPKLARLLPLLAALFAFALQAEEPDLKAFQPPLPRLDNLPRSLEDNLIVDLGRHLYYEKRLSKDGSLSCNSCHELKAYGVDGEAFSAGVGGQRVGRNSPTVYHAFMHLAQFWDGRATTVEEQAKGPILASKEMSMPSPDVVVSRLKEIPEYRQLFKEAFPRSADPITYENVGKAIGAFERYLTTPSRFDAYLGGKSTSLTTEEIKGMQLFIKLGCVTCHDSTLLGGQRYQKAGLVKPWPNQADQGRFDVTKVEADKMFFKVPSLRNVAMTAPYFHDSSARTLPDAVRLMGRHQLGLEIPPEQIKSIVAFLESLTGDIPADFVAQRKLEARKSAQFE